MAKSDPNSNGLRQDQPECPRVKLGGLGGYTVWCTHCVVDLGESVVDRPDLTELPGLTSDPICTADRRGEVLISFGTNG